MADDPNPALRAELTAAIAILDPDIRGLDDLANVSVSQELRAEFVSKRKALSRRRDLCQSVLDNLDATFGAVKALEADGYPTMVNTRIAPQLFGELKGQKSDIEAAIALFDEDNASTLSVNLGEPAGKGT